MTDAGEEEPSLPASSSGNTGFRAVATWGAMITAGVVPWGLILLLEPAAGGGVLTGLSFLALPLPALLVAVLHWRPARPLPHQVPADDWGERLGWGWVQLGHRTHWIREDDVPHFARQPSPISPTLEHAGLQLEVPPPGTGLPPMFPTVTNATFATMVPIVGVTLAAAITMGDGIGMAALVICIGLVCALISAILPMVPWALLLGLVEWSLERRVPTEVKLTGQRVEASGQTFVLGHPSQMITHEAGTLTLENDHGTLEIRGAAAHLAYLHGAFETASRESGAEAEVPVALRRLQAER